MRIREPLDVMILQVLSTGEQANPVRVRYLIDQQHGGNLAVWDREEMWQLDYITQRINKLRRLELLDRVPPENSALHQINERGYYVLSRWTEGGQRDFSASELGSIDEDDVDASRVPPDAITPQ